MPFTSVSAQSSLEATEVPLWTSPMSSLSTCRGSVTAPPLPSSQPSSEEQPRPIHDELKEKVPAPAYNHTLRPLEFMTLNHTDVQLVSELPTQLEVANKPSGRSARNKDNVEVWLLGHSSTPLSLHRQKFDDRARGGSSKASPSTPCPPLMCSTVLPRTSMSSSQHSPVSTVFDTEPSSTAESETDWSPNECAPPTNKLFVGLKSHTELQKDVEGNSSSSDDEAKFSLPKRQTKRTPTMSVHDKLRAGMYTTIPLTPDNLHRYMDAYAAQCPSTPRLRRVRSETPSQPMVQSCEGKSGWERMKESVRKMEREAAAGEKEKESGVAKWRVGVSAWD